MGCFDNSDLLSEININIVQKLMQLLQLKVPEIIYSSKFKKVNDATASPNTLTTEDTISLNLSTPAINAIPSNGRPITFNTKDNIIIPVPGIPAAPIADTRDIKIKIT